MEVCIHWTGILDSPFTQKIAHKGLNLASYSLVAMGRVLCSIKLICIDHLPGHCLGLVASGLHIPDDTCIDLRLLNANYAVVTIKRYKNPARY